MLFSIICDFPISRFIYLFISRKINDPTVISNAGKILAGFSFPINITTNASSKWLLLNLDGKDALFDATIRYLSILLNPFWKLNIQNIK